MRRQHALVLLLFFGLAIAMTWPLMPAITRAVAYPGDPYINAWVLDWDWYAVAHQPLSLFDANIFYPARYSLAFSENMFGIALLLFPLRAAGIAAITAHNLAVLGGFAFSGFAAYLLGRFVTGSCINGIAGGVFYAFVPFRFNHLSHVQHVWGATLPILLLSLLWYARKPSWPRAWVFAAAFLLNGLCNVHWLLFGSIAVAASAVVLRPRILPLLICTGGAAVLLIAFLMPYAYVAKLYSMRRSWSETMSYSARPRDWLVSDFHNRFYNTLRDPSIDPERWLFPGALSIILSLAALRSRERTVIRIAIVWLALGFIGSLGLHTIFHRFLFSHVPGFHAIRVPARWAAVAHVGLAVLVSLGTGAIARRRAWLGFTLIMLMLFELNAAPIRWYMADTTIPPVERWVRDNKPHAVIELPISTAGEYLATLHATAHHRSIVNGSSGFAPPEYLRLVSLATELSDDLIPELRRLRVSHIIVHANALDARGRAWLARALHQGRLGFVGRFDSGIFGDWLFTTGPGESSLIPQLEVMLRGEPTYSETPFGVLERPGPEQTVTSRASVSGFAFSVYGVQKVNLLVNNGRIRLPTILYPDSLLSHRFPWYDATTRPRFEATFTKRPPGVWNFTDIQVEIIDGRGGHTLLEDRWINWP